MNFKLPFRPQRSDRPAPQPTVQQRELTTTPDEEFLSFAEIATLLRVSDMTVRMAYIAQLMPEPESRTGRSPLWSLRTVHEWSNGLDLTVFEEYESEEPR